MSLTSSLSREVDSTIRGRWNEYYQSGAVRIRDGDAWSVRARVRGTETYKVDLERDGNTVYASCTCPYFDDRLDICKHIWATVRAAEAKGYLRGSGADPKHLVPDADGSEDSYEEGDDGEAYEEFEPAPPYRPAPYNPPPRPQRPGRANNADWKRALTELRDRLRRGQPAPHEEWPAGREILYVVDVDRSRQDGALHVELAHRTPKKDSDWSKPKFQRVPHGLIPRLPDPADRQILGLLTGTRDDYGSYYGGYYGGGYYYDSSPGRYRLSQEALEMLVPLMVRTGRGRLRMSANGGELHPLAWDEREPWELALEVRQAGKQYTLTGALRRGEERRPLTEPVLLVAGGLVFWPDRVARLRDHGAFGWVTLLREKGALTVPAKQADDLLAELAKLPQVPPLELPEELRYEEVTATPRPRLKVKAPRQRSAYGYGYDRLTGELAFDYGGAVVPADEPGRGAWQKESRRLVVRDPRAERAAAERVRQLGFRQRTYGAPGLELAPRNLPRVVRELLHEGWFVEAEGKVYRQPGDFKVAVKSGIDWFELHADVAFGDTKVSLPALLAAVRRGEDIVRLDDGTFGMVPEGWLKKYGLLAGLGETAGDHVRFSRGQAGLLDALLAEQPGATWDEAFAKPRDALMRFAGVAPAGAPAAFVGELRGYQREGLGWLQFLQTFGFGGCLADDMGLGKTVQVLALLAGRAAEKPGRASLVVVPKSLVFNWAEEAARFVPGLRVRQHVGVERRKAGDRFDDCDAVLTT